MKEEDKERKKEKRTPPKAICEFLAEMYLGKQWTNKYYFAFWQQLHHVFENCQLSGKILSIRRSCGTSRGLTEPCQNRSEPRQNRTEPHENKRNRIQIKQMFGHCFGCVSPLPSFFSPPPPPPPPLINIVICFEDGIIFIIWTTKLNQDVKEILPSKKLKRVLAMYKCVRQTISCLHTLIRERERSRVYA